MAEIYCDICDNQINDWDEYDDGFVRVCKSCEIEDGV